MGREKEREVDSVERERKRARLCGERKRDLDNVER